MPKPSAVVGDVRGNDQFCLEEKIILQRPHAGSALAQVKS
jgi:hypothetical protein